MALPVLVRLLAAFNRVIELLLVGVLSAWYYAEAAFLSIIPVDWQKQKDLTGRRVLLTGGAGGLGESLAIRLIRAGAEVVLWDNNEEALERVRKRLQSETKSAEKAGRVYSYVVDVADRVAVYKNAKLVQEDLGTVDVVINNAAVVCGQTFLEIPDRMIEKTFQVNCLAHYWVVKAFLPEMLERPEGGHIVTMGSMTGLLGTFRCTDYSATKYANIGFHESLYTELKTMGYDKIKMTLICPYFIDTGMFAGCRPRNLPMLQPSEVADRILTAIKREELFLTIPAFFRYMLPLKNFLPAKLCWTFMYRVVQGPQSMMGMRRFQEVDAA